MDVVLYFVTASYVHASDISLSAITDGKLFRVFDSSLHVVT